MAVQAGARRQTGEWVRATASLLLLTFGVGACGLTSGQRSTPQELSRVALAFETGVRQFFHPGFRPGPAVITTEANADGEVAIFEERRVSPFGVPIDALSEEVPGEPTVESNGFFAREAYGALEKQRDHTTGYTHHVARWMAPQLGRWLSPDPLFLADPMKSLESPGELNLYSYAGNNPVAFVDFEGTSMAHFFAYARCAGQGQSMIASKIQGGIDKVGELFTRMLGSVVGDARVEAVGQAKVDVGAEAFGHTKVVGPSGFEVTSEGRTLAFWGRADVELQKWATGRKVRGRPRPQHSRYWCEGLRRQRIPSLSR